MRCYAYTEDGKICGAEATVLDLARGFYVCPEHGPRNVVRDAMEAVHRFEPGDPIPVAEFRKLIAEAYNEASVKNIVLWHQEHLVGTMAEIGEALNFAHERELHFTGPAEGVPAAVHAGEHPTSNIQHPTSNELKAQGMGVGK